MKVYLQKNIGTTFIAADPETEELARKMKPGEILHGNFSRMRNPAFHRKMFALFNFAFDHWEPGELSSQYGKPEKNFDQFRGDLVILAGYFEVVTRLDGSVRIKPKSLSYGSMDQDEFEKVYQAVLTVVVQRILPQYTKEDVNSLIEQALVQFG